MDNSQITQGKSLKSFIYWAVSNPFFCLYSLESIWIPHSNLVVEKMELKRVFPCSRILYLCLESLGLDITSVILNRFKMVATYPFLWFRYIKESCELLILVQYTLNRKSFTNSQKACLNWNLSIYIWKIYLRSWPNLLIDTNPRFLPPRNESILSTRAPSCTIYTTTPPKKLKWEF